MSLYVLFTCLHLFLHFRMCDLCIKRLPLTGDYLSMHLVSVLIYVSILHSFISSYVCVFFIFVHIFTLCTLVFSYIFFHMRMDKRMIL